MNIANIIATELTVSLKQITSAIELLDAGATVPFISRYRKEATGGLSDTQLRQLEERLHYLRELDARREVILKSIAEQNKLTQELEQSIRETQHKSILEDLYLPYKPKRRTKAQIAKEAGLEPLAMQLLTDPTIDYLPFAESFINPDFAITSAKDALEGARHILLELFAENANLMGYFRDYIWDHGIIKTEVIKGRETDGSKFADYFNYLEPIKKIPSHRALALLRGQREDFLKVTLTLNDDQTALCIAKIQQEFKIEQKQRSADAWLIETANWAFHIKFFIKLELELMTRLRDDADLEAIRVFANNLRHLLMTSPAGSRVTLGLDPGFRTGVKVVVIDGTGKLLFHTSIFPHPPKQDWDGSIALLAKICKQFQVELVSIGNGTASRETDKLVAELKKNHPELKLTSIVISEAGASVYSASEFAAKEFPELDVSYRGAVSIARRLQDPLAELVKIDPKSIGVGQYQHDVNQVKLSQTLQSVMEDCVNAVGVDINTASLPLLTCVAGLNQSIAKQIIQFRNEHGAFKNRLQFKKVPRLGDKAFEQAAGFLRIINGDNPLDSSAVHPEAYVVVEKILLNHKKPLNDIMNNSAVLKAINPRDYTDAQFGVPTVIDIIKELEKPGRDPRPQFKTATFQTGIDTINDLKPGMLLEGVVTNVANFGAFVDIGVHQDGLVHISMLSDKRIAHPQDFIKLGEIVKVKVVEVDVARKRIQLTMRLNDNPEPRAANTNLSQTNPKQKNMKTAPLDPKETSLGHLLLSALKSSN